MIDAANQRPQGLGLYVLRDGVPVREPDLLVWGAWFHSTDPHIADTEVNGARVSTVFLGFDHSFGRYTPPVLFETMIFGGDHDGYQDRYATREEALAGHEAAVLLAGALVEQAPAPPEPPPVLDIAELNRIASAAANRHPEVDDDRR